VPDYFAWLEKGIKSVKWAVFLFDSIENDFWFAIAPLIDLIVKSNKKEAVSKVKDLTAKDAKFFAEYAKSLFPMYILCALCDVFASLR